MRTRRVRTDTGVWTVTRDQAGVRIFDECGRQRLFSAGHLDTAAYLAGILARETGPPSRTEDLPSRMAEDFRCP